jgi:hypothetical protein
LPLKKSAYVPHFLYPFIICWAKNEIMLLAGKWIELDIVMLRERNPAQEPNSPYFCLSEPIFLLICGI